MSTQTPELPTAWKPFTPAAEPAKKSLVAKLAEVMAAVGRVPKHGRNDFHGYDYATEADIAECIRQELAKRSVMLIPAILEQQRTAVGEKGSVLTTLVMEMEFLDGETGESIKKPWLGYGSDKDDKGGYKAMTGAEKYFLLKTFLIPTGDDPERDEKPSRGKASLTVEAPGPDTISNAAEREPEKRGAAARGETAALPVPSGGFLRIDKVSSRIVKGGKTRYEVFFSDGRKASTIKESLGALCEQLCQNKAPLQPPIVEKTQFGLNLLEVHRLLSAAPPSDAKPSADAAWLHGEPEPPADDESVPF